MGSISSRLAFVSASFPLVCVVVALGLGGCGAGPASGKQSTEAAGSGTLRLALTGGGSGQQYRLRNARFTIDGPVHVVLDSESKPDAGALSTELAVGDYQVQVGGGWILERLDAGGPVAVQATLSSANPATVHIGLDAVTALPFRFVTDRAEVSLGSGTLEISAEVSERGLALLAGQLGGLGSGDGTGANARFFGLMGVVGDGAGHLYVADSYNATIRRVTLGTLGVSTVAGSPMLSGSADGAGPDARFYNPRGMCLDAAGNVYVADRINLTLRKIDAGTGAVTTFAGTAGVYGSLDGVGPNAAFSDPTACTSDADKLYVTDDNVIREVSLATREVTTLAGLESDPFGASDGVGSAARFSNPHGIIADHAGHLFVADTNNAAIRKIDLASAEVTTVAGSLRESGFVDGSSSVARFAQPSGITLDGNGNLFVTETGNSAVRAISLVAGTVSTLAGGSYGDADGVGNAARFAYPEALTWDGAGSVWVADSSNDVLRRIDVTSGAVTTPVGAKFPNTEFADGVGANVGVGFVPSMQSDSAGNVYLANGAVIRKLEVATGTVTTIAGRFDDAETIDGVGSAARFSDVHALTLDGTALYMCDGVAIRKLDLETGEVSTLAGTPGAPGTADGVGSEASFDTPISITSDGAGHLYVSDFIGLMRRVDVSTRRVTTIAGIARAYSVVDGVGASASFWSPYAIQHDGADSLYIMDGGTLRRMDLTTAAVTSIAGGTGGARSVDGVGFDAQFSLSNALARDDAGHLFVADTQGNAIRKVDLSTLAVTTVVGNLAASGVLLGGLPGRITLPQSLAVLPGGSLVISSEAALLLATF